MSNVGFLERLMEGANTEWETLGEITKIQRGKRLVKNQLEESGSYAVYQNSMTPLGYYHESNVPSGTTFIICAGAAGEIGYSDKQFWAADDVYFFLTPDYILNKFLYYFLLTKQGVIYSQVRRASIPRLSKSAVEKIQIPIPSPENPKKSLEIQTEIVRILDAFTAVTSELTSELTTRKKQYNYYRDKLLSFEDGKAEWRSLGEIAEYSKARISACQLNEDNYVGVDNLLQDRAGKTKSSHTPETGTLTKYEKHDILIGNIRPYLKKIWHADRCGGCNGDVLVIHPTDNSINTRYLYQVLIDDSFFEYNMQHAKGAKMPRGNKAKILEYRVPIPPIAEQIRIVEILEKFETLTNSISQGLPREIELRQKQYEHYRDLLFSFPKPESIAA